MKNTDFSVISVFDLTCSLKHYWQRCYAGFIVSIFLFAQLSAAPLQLDSLVQAGKNHLYNLRVQKAAQTFKEIQSRYPKHPHGFVYQAYTTAIVFSMNRGKDMMRQQFFEQIQKAVQISDAYQQRAPENGESYFYQGIAYGVKGLYHVVDYNYLRAYWNGRKAKISLQEALKRDSTYYDAYLGLGLFHYYADLLPGVLKFFANILGFKGDRSLGMKEIQMTRQKGHLLKFEAEFTYTAIRYFLEGKKDVPVAAMRSMQRRYPENQALDLLLAYHYRRTGYVSKCIKHCKRLPDTFNTELSLLATLKYYNLGIAYYELNLFSKSDSVFQILDTLSISKSPYYLAAIAYYRGHIADLNFDRPKALQYYQKIPATPQTEYWHHLSRMFVQYPMDSLTYRYFSGRNLLYSRFFSKSMAQIQALMTAIAQHPSSPVNPNLKFLVSDLLGESYYYTHQLELSREIFERIVPELKHMHDPFRKSWLYIHYSRCLREVGAFDLARNYLEKAGELDDKYTRLIIAREEFILAERIKHKKWSKS